MADGAIAAAALREIGGLARITPDGRFHFDAATVTPQQVLAAVNLDRQARGVDPYAMSDYVRLYADDPEEHFDAAEKDRLLRWFRAHGITPDDAGQT